MEMQNHRFQWKMSELPNFVEVAQARVTLKDLVAHLRSLLLKQLKKNLRHGVGRSEI